MQIIPLNKAKTYKTLMVKRYLIQSSKRRLPRNNHEEVIIPKSMNYKSPSYPNNRFYQYNSLFKFWFFI